MKKIVTMISLITVLSCSFLFGNGQDEVAQTDGPLTVRMLYPDNASYPLKEDWLVLEEIAKATGVDLQLQTVPDVSSDYNAKMQIVFASGDIPEIVYSKAPAATQDVIDGVLLPISDYVDQMPNLKKFLNDYDYTSDMNNLRESDGKYYTLPVKAETKRMRIHQWLVRVDIFEKHNIPLPKTLDDVYAAGVKLKELYPESNPIINRFGSGNLLSLIGSGFGTLAGWSLSSNGHVYDEATDSWVYAPTSPEFKELLTYMNKLLTAGVLDEEFTSLDSTVYEQRVTQSETFIMIDWVGNQVRYNIEGRKTNPDFNVQPIFPVAGPRGDYATERGTMYEQYWVLPASLKDHPRFEEVLGFIDWFYSEEASIITTFGAEGISYQAENGNLVYTDPNADQSKEYGLLNNALNVRRHPDFFTAINGQEISDLFDEIAKAGAVKSPDPKVRYNEEELSELQLLIPPVNDYFGSMMEKFIYGFESLDDWDAYVAELENKGSKKITALINNAWKKQ